MTAARRTPNKGAWREKGHRKVSTQRREPSKTTPEGSLFVWRCESAEAGDEVEVEARKVES